MRLFYHRYLIIVSCSSVSIDVLSMLVLLLMLPVLTTHRDPQVKEEGLVPSGAHGGYSFMLRFIWRKRNMKE